MNTHLQSSGSDLNYFDDEGRLVEFIDDEPIARTYEDGKKLIEQFLAQTDFLSRYENSNANIDVLTRVCKKLNKHNPRPDGLTLKRFVQAYETIDFAGGEGGESGRLEKLPPPVQEAPRARNNAGRFVNPVLAAYYALLDDPSVPASEVHKRMIGQFGADAFRAALESEAKPQQVASESDVSEEEVIRLRNFAAAYRREPSLRFLGGFVTVGGQQFTRQQLDETVEAAAKFNLL